MSMLPLLIAEVATAAEPATREFVTWDLRRVAQFDDPRLLWMLLGGGILIIAACVIWLYRRERTSLPVWARLLFPVLRITAWLGAASIS